MRLFLDTNILLEYLCGRPKAMVVRDLFDAIEGNADQAFISTASFCTIAYYIDITLKQRGIHKPEKTAKTREILNLVLGIASIADVNHEAAVSATNDPAFSDIEDSMQYQCAVGNHCDVLITFNVKDFNGASSAAIRVMTPEEFLQTR